MPPTPFTKARALLNDSGLNDPYLQGGSNGGLHKLRPVTYHEGVVSSNMRAQNECRRKVATETSKTAEAAQNKLGTKAAVPSPEQSRRQTN